MLLFLQIQCIAFQHVSYFCLGWLYHIKNSEFELRKARHFWHFCYAAAYPRQNNFPCFFDTYSYNWNCTGNKVIGTFSNGCRSWPKIRDKNCGVWFLPEHPWEIRFFLHVPVSHLHFAGKSRFSFLPPWDLFDEYISVCELLPSVESCPENPAASPFLCSKPLSLCLDPKAFVTSTNNQGTPKDAVPATGI